MKLITLQLFTNIGIEIHYHLFRQLSNKNLHVLFSMFYQQNTHTGLWWFRWYAHIPSDWSRLLQAPSHLKEFVGLPICILINFFNFLTANNFVKSIFYLAILSWIHPSFLNGVVTIFICSVDWNAGKTVQP